MNIKSTIYARRVVQIVKPELNKEIDSYIGKRRQELEPFEISKEKREKMEDYEDETLSKTNQKITLSTLLRRRIPDEEEIEKEQKARKNKEIQEIEEEVEDIDEMEDELENEKESLFYKLRKMFGGKGKEELYEEAEIEVAEQEQAILDEQVKETIKILHRWLEQLPPDKLDQFKRSADFARYKELLRKFGMIKN